MDKHIFKQLMEGYLNGNLSSGDRQLLQRWYDSFGESETGVPELEEADRAALLGDELDKRIRQAIASEQADFSVQKRSVWRLSFPAIAAAAILLVACGVTALWFVQRPNHKAGIAEIAQKSVFREVKTGVRQLKRLDLPDGSVLHVNANSVLRIPEQWGSEKRTVFLDEGEAYFEVARDTLKPFVVQTRAGLSVEVLGTAFNVRSYDVLPNVTVAVGQGKVRVRDTVRVLDELVANEGLVYHKAEKRPIRVEVVAETAKDWTKGVIRLEKSGFAELALALHNLYGVRLKSDDPQTASYRYNLILHADRPLGEALDLICSIHKTTYRRNGYEIALYP